MAPEAVRPVLEVSGLRVSFETRGGRRDIVRGVDLTVGPGEIVGVVGESGSGKSTVALAIADLLPGNARVEAEHLGFAGADLDPDDHAARRKILGSELGVVFQDPSTSLDPTMTVGAQVRGPLQQHLGLSRRQARARAVEILALAGLPQPAVLAERYPHQLSGGQRQRAMIAIAISCSPRLIIADEPTTALDVTVQAEILRLFASFRDELGIAMIFVSHNLAVVGDLADRVAVMYAGRLVEIGTSAQVLERPQHPYTAALLACVPRMGRGRGPLSVIEGSPPELGVKDHGCAFAPRCAFATAVCRESVPVLREVDGRAVACWNAPVPTFAGVTTAPGTAGEQS